MRRVARIAQAVARAADGEALFIQQRTDAADQQDFMMLIVAAVAAALDRLELGEFLFPVAQHMRFDAAEIADFSYGEVTIGGTELKRNGGFGTNHEIGRSHV